MPANSTSNISPTLKADTSQSVGSGIPLAIVNAFNAEKKSIKSELLQLNPALGRTVSSRQALKQLASRQIGLKQNAYNVCLIAQELPRTIQKRGEFPDADLKEISESLAHAAVVGEDIEDPHLDFIAGRVQTAASKNAEVSRNAQNIFGTNRQLNSVVGQTQRTLSQPSNVDGLQGLTSEIRGMLPGFAAGMNAKSKFQDDIMKYSLQYASPEERAEVQEMMPSTFS